MERQVDIFVEECEVSNLSIACFLRLIVIFRLLVHA